MKEVYNIDKPIIAIVHFKSDEAAAEVGHKLVHYQVTMYPEHNEGKTQLSPTGDFIRFGEVQGDELTGWQDTSNIVMDEMLFNYESMSAVPFNKQMEVRGEEVVVELIEKTA